MTRLAAALGCLCVLGLAARPAHPQVDDTRPVVRGLAFEGNRAIRDEVLRASIATSNSSFWRWTGFLGQRRYFNEVEFRRDVLRLTLLYRQSGFVEATVDTIVHRDDGAVRIRFLIHEGRPVRVQALDVSGTEGIVDSARLRRRLPLQVGDPFNRAQLQASVDTIRAFLADRGYPFAEVFRNFDEDRVHRVARVLLDVVPGPRVVVDSVIVRGTDRVDERVVRRTLALRPGDAYSQQAVRESQIDLYRTELFTTAAVQIADTTGRSPDDSAVTLEVVVAEAPLNRVRIGMGIGSLDCLRGQTALTFHNFAGGGRSLRLRGGVSHVGVASPVDAGFKRHVCGQLRGQDPQFVQLNYSTGISLTEPFLFSRRTSGSVSLSAERQSEFRAFVREGFGGDLALSQSLGRDVRATLAYGLSRTRTLAEPAVFCTFLNVCTPADVGRFQDWRRRSTLSVAVVRDRTGSPLDPRRGSRLSVEVRHASRAIGSDELSQFSKAVVELASYHAVGRRGVIAWRVRIGTIITPVLGGAGQPIQFVPPEERFYAGGPNSVRGFSQNELGPLVRVIEDTVVSANGDTTFVGRPAPIGGNEIVVANVEWRFPLPLFSERVSGAVFLDAGQVFAREQDGLALGRLRFTPGAGTRVNSPLGPVRFDVALNPYDPPAAPLYDPTTLTVRDPAHREPVSLLGRFRVHFSVGHAF